MEKRVDAEADSEKSERSEATALWVGFFLLLAAAEILLAMAIMFSAAVFLENWVTFPWALVYLATPCLVLALDCSVKAFMLFRRHCREMWLRGVKP
jgi:cation transport ATPase